MTLVKTQIDRRSFLKVSALSGAGMMIGFNWLASCTSPGDALKAPEEWFDAKKCALYMILFDSSTKDCCRLNLIVTIDYLSP